MSPFFDPDNHTFRSPTFESIVNEAIGFLEASPVQPLPVPERFIGPGIYALYYRGDFEPYARITLANQDKWTYPIYTGKAVPKGARQGRKRDSTSTELYSRLREHARSIEQTENLDLADFACRLTILNEEMSDLIVTVEAALIRRYAPLWNSIIDGFGNHDPGKGRRNQAVSEWDTLHPGRSWVERMTGPRADRGEVLAKVETYAPKTL